MLDRILRAEIAGMFSMDSLELKVPLGRLQDCKTEIERLKIADCRLNDWRLEIVRLQTGRMEIDRLQFNRLKCAMFKLMMQGKQEKKKCRLKVED